MAATECHANVCVSTVVGQVLITIILMITGIVGNGTVLKIYYKEKKQASKIYIIALAWIDLVGCVVFLPQIPFWQLVSALGLSSPVAGYISVGLMMQKQSYLFVQIAMVFDRIFAVFKPHSFNQLRRKTNLILLMIFAALQITIVASATIFYSSGDSTGFILAMLAYIPPFMVAFCIYVVAYPAIAVKLWKQNRRIGAATGNQQNSNIVSESQQRTKHHIKTLKLYVAVLALFLFTFLPAVGYTIVYNLGIGTYWSLYMWVSYIYYINTIGNPFIYYIFIKKFRNDVRVMFRNVVSRVIARK